MRRNSGNGFRGQFLAFEGMDGRRLLGRVGREFFELQLHLLPRVMGIRDDSYRAALAVLINAQHRLPFSRVWGDGTTSSSDGQFFRGAKRGASGDDINARYGVDHGFSFYTHVSDQRAPYHVNVISAATHEAPYVLDGLTNHGTDLRIVEHYTETGGATDHAFALCTMLGFRFCPPGSLAKNVVLDTAFFIRPGARGTHLGQGETLRPDTLMQTSKLFRFYPCGRGGPYVFCASCRDEQRSGEAQPPKRAGRAQSTLRAVLQARCPCALSHRKNLRPPLLDPTRAHVPALGLGSEAAGLAPLRKPADRRRRRYAKPGRSRTATHPVIDRRQKPAAQIH